MIQELILTAPESLKVFQQNIDDILFITTGFTAGMWGDYTLSLHDRNRDASLLYEDTLAMLARSVDYAGQLVVAHEYMPERVDVRQHDVGRIMGNVGLRLGVYSPVVRGAFPPVKRNDDLPLNDWDMQETVRNIAMQTLTEARMMAGQMQVHPSVAQLADPYSPLSVHWYRNAPGSAQTAITEALAA